MTESLQMLTEAAHPSLYDNALLVILSKTGLPLAEEDHLQISYFLLPKSSSSLK